MSVVLVFFSKCTSYSASSEGRDCSASQLCLQKGLLYSYLSYYKHNIATFISVLNIMSICILFFIIIITIYSLIIILIWPSVQIELIEIQCISSISKPLSISLPLFFCPVWQAPVLGDRTLNPIKIWPVLQYSGLPMNANGEGEGRVTRNCIFIKTELFWLYYKTGFWLSLSLLHFNFLNN